MEFEINPHKFDDELTQCHLKQNLLTSQNSLQPLNCKASSLRIAIPPNSYTLCTICHGSKLTNSLGKQRHNYWLTQDQTVHLWNSGKFVCQPHQANNFYAVMAAKQFQTKSKKICEGRGETKFTVEWDGRNAMPIKV